MIKISEELWVDPTRVESVREQEYFDGFYITISLQSGSVMVTSSEVGALHAEDIVELLKRANAWQRP